MKLFIVLSVIFASVLGQEAQQGAWEDSSGLWVELSPRRNAIGSDESKVQTPSLLNDLLNRQNVLRSNVNAAGGSSLDILADYPDAAEFEAKVRSRLESSTYLSGDLRNELTHVANEKFNKCRVYTGGRAKGCLGHATGQIMHLIGTVEGMQRRPH